MRLELKYSLVLLILFSCHTRASESLAVSGQSAEVIEEELIVSSLRLPATTLEAGSSVAVITAADITARGYTFALDAITSAAGVTTNQNGAYGGTGSVRIRGAASEQTLVLIDGMVVNDPTSPGGGFNFATLDVADIEPETLILPHRVEAFDDQGVKILDLDFSDARLHISHQTPDAPEIIFACFFYMH